MTGPSVQALPYLTDQLLGLPEDASLAFVFPGQGAQSVGMGADVADASPIARDLFRRADEVLETHLSLICFEGPEADLTSTDNAQPAMLVASLALMAAAFESGAFARRPAFVAGHSLGQYTALVAVGAVRYEEALLLVRERGRLMHRACLERPGTMAAIVGLEEQVVEEICRQSGAEPSNYNSTSQIVIGGTAEAVTLACKLAREKRGRGLPIAVAGAFHTSLMRGAVEGFAARVGEVVFSEPGIPVVSNVTAEPIVEAAQIANDLVLQIASPVCWAQTMSFMIRNGVGTITEIGPGRVLTAITKRSYPELSAISIDSAASLVSPSV